MVYVDFSLIWIIFFPKTIILSYNEGTSLNSHFTTTQYSNNGTFVFQLEQNEDSWSPGRFQTDVRSSQGGQLQEVQAPVTYSFPHFPHARLELDRLWRSVATPRKLTHETMMRVCLIIASLITDWCSSLYFPITSIMCGWPCQKWFNGKTTALKLRSMSHYVFSSPLLASKHPSRGLPVPNPEECVCCNLRMMFQIDRNLE